jgi:hypothetical protein
MIPRCPDTLPPGISTLLRQLGQESAKSDICPRFSRKTRSAWDSLLSAWVADNSLPLLVRKSGLVRGSEVTHSSSRRIVPTDNSPAQWACHLAFRDIVPTVQEIHEYFRTDSIPMSFAHKKGEKDQRRYHCTLGKYSINKYGWQLCHVQDVGLKSRTLLEHTSIGDLKKAFTFLLSPANFFVVPKVWGGMGDTAEFIEAFRNASPNK